MMGPASGVTGNSVALSAALLGWGCTPWAQALLCALAMGAAAPVWSAEPCADGYSTKKGNLPCTWVGCEFRKDADGVLAQSGTCSTRSTVSLYLNYRGITGLSAGVFDDVLNVQLYLDHNQLTSLPAGIFDPLTKLTYLSLGVNQLTSMPAGIFDPLTKLTDLSLYNNQLTSLPAGIFDPLTQLKVLYLHENQLTSLPAGVFDTLTQLTDLWLSGNQLTSLPAGIFDPLTQLKVLYLHENQLTSMPAGIFDTLTQLTDLWLYNNQAAAHAAGVRQAPHAVDAAEARREAVHRAPRERTRTIQGLGAAAHAAAFQSSCSLTAFWRATRTAVAAEDRRAAVHRAPRVSTRTIQGLGAAAAAAGVRQASRGAGAAMDWLAAVRQPPPGCLLLSSLGSLSAWLCC
jgi:hypothetical protein